MIESVTVLSVVLAAVALIFAACAAAFIARLDEESSAEDDTSPKAAVLLSLRGADPHLADCLRSLIAQDYPDYRLHIVVDSDTDPAWNIVQRIVKDTKAPNVTIDTLRDPLRTCGLKCSALLQMLETLDKDVEVVGLIDGDVVPHEQWLRQLAMPFKDENVGVTFGIPWYLPPTARFASLVRKVSWAPAAILMGLSGWVWGGTAALPARVFRHHSLTAGWSHSISSDAPIQGVVTALGLRPRWVPDLIMPNHEEGRFRALLSHLSRSLSTSRLYLRHWPLIFVAAVSISGAFLILALMCAAAAVAGETEAAALSAAALIAYWLLLMALMLRVDARIRRVLDTNGHPEPHPSAGERLKTLLAIPVAHAFYFAAVARALFARTLTWRGVHYAIKGKWDIHLVETRSIIQHHPAPGYAAPKHHPGPGD